MKEKSFGELVSFLRKKKGWRQDDLAKQIGVARSVISDYETGKTLPKPERMRKLAEVLGVDFKLLLEKAEEKRLAGKNGDFEAFRNDSGKLVNLGEISDVVTLPVLGRVHAGDPNIPDEEIIDVLKLPRRIARKADYALLVEGMSMKEEGILPGDIILIKMQSDADNGQIVVARIGDEFTLKRLRKENGRIWLEPANSHYSKIEPPFEIVGRVVYLIKQFK